MLVFVAYFRSPLFLELWYGAACSVHSWWIPLLLSCVIIIAAGQIPSTFNFPLLFSPVYCRLSIPGVCEFSLAFHATCPLCSISSNGFRHAIRDSQRLRSLPGSLSTSTHRLVTLAPHRRQFSSITIDHFASSTYSGLDIQLHLSNKHIRIRFRKLS